MSRGQEIFVEKQRRISLSKHSVRMPLTQHHACQTNSLRQTESSLFCPVRRHGAADDAVLPGWEAALGPAAPSVRAARRSLDSLPPDSNTVSSFRGWTNPAFKHPTQVRSSQRSGCFCLSLTRSLALCVHVCACVRVCVCLCCYSAFFCRLPLTPYGMGLRLTDMR